MTPRRFYLLKAREAHRVQDHALESAWLAKHAEQGGTPLPADFTARGLLELAAYVTLEDLFDVTVEDLKEIGLTDREAAAVIAARAV